MSQTSYKIKSNLSGNFALSFIVPLVRPSLEESRVDIIRPLHLTLLHKQICSFTEDQNNPFTTKTHLLEQWFT